MEMPPLYPRRGSKSAVIRVDPPFKPLGPSGETFQEPQRRGNKSIHIYLSNPT
jgi:hypothetical protein